MKKVTSKQANKQPKFKKITMNMPLELYNDISKEANSIGLTITGEIITLCREGLKQNKAVELMPIMLEQLLNEQKARKIKSKVSR